MLLFFIFRMNQMPASLRPVQVLSY